MAKIVTLTLNPCIDKSTSIDGVVPEKKLRCAEPLFEPGGGGLNVARAIKKLGGETIAVYPSGGYSGSFLEQLMLQEGLNSAVIRTKNKTRENFIVFDSANKQEYRFGMPGEELYETEWRQCLSLIEQQREVEFVVASGSMPPGVPLTIFSELAEICKKRGAKLIVDTSGEALVHVAKEPLFLLKPNLVELATLAGISEVKPGEAEDVAREVINRGKIEMLLISAGALGAVLVTKDQVMRMIPPEISVKSAVGAGDSMVAGFILCLSRGNSLRDAFQYAVASGAAAAMTSGSELCRLEDVERLLPLIRSDSIFSATSAAPNR
jgi:6-phosphofructokinase 2